MQADTGACATLVPAPVTVRLCHLLVMLQGCPHIRVQAGWAHADATEISPSPVGLEELVDSQFRDTFLQSGGGASLTPKLSKCQGSKIFKKHRWGGSGCTPSPTPHLPPPTPQVAVCSSSCARSPWTTVKNADFLPPPLLVRFWFNWAMASQAH